MNQHVQITLALNWDKQVGEADYSPGAEKLWKAIRQNINTGTTDICPTGQQVGRGHALAWKEQTAYGNPNDGGLWSCYDCGGKLYTKLNGEYVEWTGP